MGQMTLGGAPISEHEIEAAQEKSSPAPKITRSLVYDESDSGWSQPYVLAVTKNDKEEGQKIDQVELFQESSLEGIKLSLSTSVSHEPPHGFLGGMWGGGGELADNEIQQYFDELMEEKKEAAKQAYRKFKNPQEPREFGRYKHEYYFYRLVPMKNWIVMLDPYKKTLEYLKERGFDFEAWHKEYMAIPEHEAGSDWNAKVELYMELHNRGDSIKKQADVIKDSIRFKLGKTEEYGKKLRDMWPERGTDALMAMFETKLKELDALNKQLADLGEELERHRDDDVLSVSFIRQIL